MKTKLLFLLYFLTATLSLYAQHPLIGTWVARTDSVEETKIITPTHFMFVIRSIQTNTVVNGGGGTYTIKGNKFIEHLQTPDFKEYYVDQESYKKMKAEYDFKVENEKFYQKGDFIVSDTEKYPINHTFEKVKTDRAYPKNLGIGTWNQLSSTYWGPDGEKTTHTNATTTRYQIITPTHWMRTSTKDKKLESRMGGTYTMAENKFLPVLEYASFPVNKTQKLEITQRIAGDKMYWDGVLKEADGKAVLTFEDVYQRVNNKSNKIAAVK
jgi:hypothetical protein